MIKRYCDLCKKETKKDFSKKFIDRNPNATYYLDFNDTLGDDFTICDKCGSEKMAKKLDKIDDKVQEQVWDFQVKSWLKLRKIKKVKPIAKGFEVYCLICNKDLTQFNNENSDGEIFGFSSICLSDEDAVMCKECWEFEDEVSDLCLHPKFKNIFFKELNKIIKTK